MTTASTSRGPGRPPAASRTEVEEIAIGLMQRHGYDGVGVEAIVEAAGIGRTTFFRYFGSKPGVIWGPFDDTIEELGARLRDASADSDPLEAVRGAVTTSTHVAVSSSDVWLERFKLLDTSPALRAGAYEHWERWKQVIGSYLARRTGRPPGDAVLVAVASAYQGVFIAELRNWLDGGGTREAFLGQLDRSLAIVTAALTTGLLAEPPDA
ncbi:TetR family transcriptional regulator [Streptomyces halstedii]|uniref:acyl-CoA-like ligand-binding transcription factor n=1 Tax=Streptomyces TaxID=1883 RepID=UPI00056499D8|nr:MULTISPECIES: TetR family transcriptional regulator [Streptomyces]SCE32329.1 transcriptional regulator, TetR family [Streptomyces sp. PpalLS-921]